MNFGLKISAKWFKLNHSTIKKNTFFQEISIAFALNSKWAESYEISINTLVVIKILCARSFCVFFMTKLQILPARFDDDELFENKWKDHSWRV